MERPMDDPLKGTLPAPSRRPNPPYTGGKGGRLNALSYLLYNMVMLLASPLVAALLAQRYFSGKSKPGWRERWGHLPEALWWRADSKPRCWIHAVSAGEV